MESDIGTLLFVTSLLGAGGVGLYYYGTESGLLSGGDDSQDEDDYQFKDDELEELDDSYFVPVSRAKRNLNGNSRSKKGGRKVRFSTKRRY